MSGNPTRTTSTTRREWLKWSTHGLTGAALTSLLQQGTAHANSATATTAQTESPGDPGGPDIPTHYPAKAKRVIHICLMGGLSHLDSFDYKPELARYHGKQFNFEKKPETFFNKIGPLRKNDWDFHQRGESGLWVSDLFPHIATVADELTVIKSMVADSANHTPATFQQNTGFQFNGFPVMGSWISYGLGNETEDLPAYVVLPDSRGYPAGGTINWSNGFLPSQHQGVAFESGSPTPIPDLFPATEISTETESASRAFLGRLNRDHLQRSGLEDALAARIRSHELAARMQLAVPEVTDMASETAEVQDLYGLNGKPTADFGRNCLLARRLLEKGVRFVQIISGGSFGSPRINWDGHESVLKNHNREAKRIDQPVAALLKDLRRRGMLDDTLVLFTSEFGRTPFTQSNANQLGDGRDHNMYGFSIWMAGAGLKRGFAYGSTDEIGWKAAENPVPWHDFHATVLHLLGIDHEKLTFYHNGIERRLTNVHGEVVSALCG